MVCGLALVLLIAAIGSTLDGTPQAQTEPESERISTGAAPDAPPVGAAANAQPIAFSHRDHVTEIGLDCQLCHVYARRSPVAGIPSVEVCAGCHRQVLSEAPEIQKLLTFWENEEPIPWVRVHDLPDYSRFSHKRHVLGGLACADCHGDVAQMDVAVQVQPLSMGWCVTCHEERRASLDCLTCHY